jgi:transaldolase
MKSTSDLKIKIFADGADRNNMLEMYSRPIIKGLTTNPTLMRKAGVTDYRDFCKDILKEIRTKPISFEVFSDDIEEMERQALEITTWGDNVYVKIPITNTLRQSTTSLVQTLVQRGVKVNVTAIMTLEQVRSVAAVLSPTVPSYVSVFAGRIADTGRDPLPTMREALNLLKPLNCTELIWASPRELLNLFQADEIGCHVITATSDILSKLSLIGKDLNEYSLETVKMFNNDATSAGYAL